MKKILFPILAMTIICIISAGCVAEKPTVPQISTNISGGWHSSSVVYTDGNEFNSPDILMTMSFEQKDRLIYIKNGNRDDLGVGVFCNKEGDVFITDVSIDDFKSISYGKVIGDNMLISMCSVCTKDGDGFKKGDFFVDSRYFVRDGAVSEDVFEFTKLNEKYSLKEAYQIDMTSKKALKGDNLVITSQMNGILYGTIEQDVDGEITLRKFAASAYSKSDDSEVYLAVDENGSFWTMVYSPKTDTVEFYTASGSEFSENDDKTVCAVRVYDNDNAVKSEAVVNMVGAWTSVATEKINVNKADEKAYSGTINIVNQDGKVFFSKFGTDNTNTDYIGGSIYLPEESQFFMADPSGDEIFLIEGWVEGDVLYACTIFESFGVKSASIDVCKK